MSKNRILFILSGLVVLVLLYFFSGNIYIWLKYQISSVTEIIYVEDNVSAQNYPDFVQKINTIAKTKWYNDARLSMVETIYHSDGNYITQIFHYVSDSHPIIQLANFIEKKSFEKSYNQYQLDILNNTPQELTISYNEELTVIDTDPESGEKYPYKAHSRSDINNNKITAIKLKDVIVSSVVIVNDQTTIDQNKILISPLEAINNIKTKYGNDIEFVSMIICKKIGDDYYWLITLKKPELKLKVNVSTGEISNR